MQSSMKWTSPRQLHVKKRSSESSAAAFRPQGPSSRQVPASQGEKQRVRLLWQIQQQEEKCVSRFCMWIFRLSLHEKCGPDLHLLSLSALLDRRLQILLSIYSSSNFSKPFNTIWSFSMWFTDNCCHKQMLPCGSHQVLLQLYVCAGCQPILHTFAAVTIRSSVVSPTCAAITPLFPSADMFCATKNALYENWAQIAWEMAQASEKQETASYQISNISDVWVEAFGTGLAYSYGSESMHTTDSIPLLRIIVPKLGQVSEEPL